MYVHHRPFKKKIRALAGLGLVWRPSEVRGPSIFVDFPFINFRFDDFRAFRLDFWKALRARVLKLETNPFEWKVLIYISIDICKETAKNLSKNIFFHTWSKSPPPPPWLKGVSYTPWLIGLRTFAAEPVYSKAGHQNICVLWPRRNFSWPSWHFSWHS